MFPGALKSRSLLVLVGPTGSGKTAAGIALAQMLDGEIISADSRQIYRYLDIGTAKPTAAQRSLVRHHFIDELAPDVPFNAGEFGRRGRKVIEEIFARGRTPVVVGGSGLYVQSLIDGFFEGPGPDPEFRHAMEIRIRRGELPLLVEELRRVDPGSARRIDPTKPRRVVRALEVHHATGLPLSAHQGFRKIEIPFTPRMFGLLWERKALYERINKRCALMVLGGLMKEAEELELRGYSSALNSLNTVGYKEAFACRRGEISQAEMLRLFSKNSRRYAKRQLTWFRRDGRIRWIEMKDGMTERTAAELIAAAFSAS